MDLKIYENNNLVVRYKDLALGLLLIFESVLS